MNKFIEIPANKRSLSLRKKLYGVGINDADYIVKPEINGIATCCPYYQAWKNMMKRAFSDKFKDTHPTYKYCSVVNDWLVFSNFRRWMEKQDWEGKQLDKDILIPNNKEYGPTACIFVSAAINSLLNDSASIRGKYPQGVYFHKDAMKYHSRCNVNGKAKSLGLFSTIADAQIAYLKFKSKLVIDVAISDEVMLNKVLHNALLRHATIISSKAIEM